MQITWYGHAAFLLTGRNAHNNMTRVVLDPYRAGDVGTYAAINDEADVVAVSHENAKYHSYVDAVHGPNQSRPLVVDGLELLNQPQPRLVGGVPFKATRVWENDERREPIAMIGVELEVRVLHMGDCGHALLPDEVRACGPVDVLLALGGGPPTLALPDLVDFVTTLAPKIVIPMHFGNDKINLNLRPVEDFLSRMPADRVHFFDTPTVEVTANALPAQTQVWVLPPAR